MLQTSVQVPAESVALGQHVLVRPGEQVPLDGTITWGTANLSLQHISGEARPVKLGPGQEVPAGAAGSNLCRAWPASLVCERHWYVGAVVAKSA